MVYVSVKLQRSSVYITDDLFEELTLKYPNHL